MKARVNYVVGPSTLVPFAFDAAWSGIPTEPVEVEVADVRASGEAPSIEREGLRLGRIDARGVDYGDVHEIGGKWIPAAIDFVKATTGAQWVIPWGHNVRFSNRSEKSLSTPTSAPARHVHSDFSADFDPAQILHAPKLSPAAAEELRSLLRSGAELRWRTFNVWQQISPPPHDTPLALCDARTVLPEDIVVGRGAVGDISVDLCLFRASPRHRWLHVSDMAPGETLIFSGLDPHAGGALKRVPHTAFDHPLCPPGAAPRNSIEVRVLAVAPLN
ncbi:MAG: hypothetical protein JNJ73_09140 [Hyphomonadaceae bacterium]|nr:hypothetical protein [Hyphomonadaceae bacterium]